MGFVILNTKFIANVKCRKNNKQIWIQMRSKFDIDLSKAGGIQFQDIFLIQLHLVKSKFFFVRWFDLIISPIKHDINHIQFLSSLLSYYFIGVARDSLEMVINLVTLRTLWLTSTWWDTVMLPYNYLISTFLSTHVFSWFLNSFFVSAFLIFSGNWFHCLVKRYFNDLRASSPSACKYGLGTILCLSFFR